MSTPDKATWARWDKDAIPVWDFTPEPWRSAVAFTVADFNAKLPPIVPRLVYVPMGEMPCGRLPGKGKRGGISVCLGNLAVPGYHQGKVAHGRFLSGIVEISDSLAAEHPEGLVCHEFTHALWDVPDDYSWPRPHYAESCVQGVESTLGTWDVWYATQVYLDTSHRRHKHRHSH